MSKCSVDEMSVQLDYALKNIRLDAVEAMKKGIKKTATQTKKDVLKREPGTLPLNAPTAKGGRLKAKAPIEGPGGPGTIKTVGTLVYEGDYRSHWAIKKSYEDDYDIRMTVHVKDPEYRLTHLLEYGHAIRRKGKLLGYTRKFPHITPSKDFAKEKVYENVGKEIKVRLG